jgi:hypothetical protein
MRRLLSFAAAVCGVVSLVACGELGVSSSKVAAAAQASGCDNSGFYIENKISGSKEVIYDCSFPDGSTKCVTYAGGIANDSTDVVRLVFASTLGAKKPSCLS